MSNHVELMIFEIGGILICAVVITGISARPVNNPVIKISGVIIFKKIIVRFFESVS